MKNTIFLLFGLLLIYFIVLSGVLSCKRELAKNSSDLVSLKPPSERSILFAENSINIFTTPQLNELTTKWADEYCILNNDVKIKVINILETSLTDNFNKNSSLVFSSSELDMQVYNESIWAEVVGRDVVIPVINAGNPFINEIHQQGISMEEFAQIINESEKRNWGELFKNQQNIPFKLHITDEVLTSPGMKKFLSVNKLNLDGIIIEDGKELITSVQSDPYSVGICKITNIIDFKNQSIIENIELLPFDRNDNGEIDYKENVYGDLNVLLRGVWIGKYPRVLSNNIYSISPLKPTNKTEIAFLKWILTDGQQFLNNFGYSDLGYTERLAKVNLLDEYKTEIIPTNNYALSDKALFYYVYFPIIVILFFTIIIMVMIGVQYINNYKKGGQRLASLPNFVFNEDSIESPKGLYYDKTHTWAFMEKDGMVKVGIGDFLQHVTGPLTSVKLKYAGERIKKGKKILSIIQTGKQLDIYAPFSGTIIEFNQALTTDSSILNSSPYVEGWIYKIEPTNWLKEIQFFITGDTYKEWLKSEFERLKEFFAITINHEKVEYAHILQDGGELKDSILLGFGPEVWEDFQTSFIDESF